MKNIDDSNFIHNKKLYFGDIQDELWYDYKWQINNSKYATTKLIEIANQFYNSDPVENSVDSNILLKNFIFENNIKNFKITPYLFCLINFNNFFNDPVVKQFVPTTFEYKTSREIDPFNEYNSQRNPIKNIIKRYPDRVVIITTNFCPSYCRYCTRKWNWEKSVFLTEDDLNDIEKYLKENKKVREVIISGGEPLTINIDLLDKLLNMLYSINTIESVRIGTRSLTFLPYLINDNLVNILSKYFPIWIITQFNHYNEITKDTLIAIKKLLKTGNIAIANQSVLLKGVNDNYEVLTKLFTTLESILIKPYYLFYPDIIRGTEHFVINLNDAINLYDSLRGNIGGLNIPAFIVDTVDVGKIPLTNFRIVGEEENFYIIENFKKEIIRVKK